MSVQSKLPAFITGLAYVAMGLALSVSWAQMQAVLAVQADLNGEYIKVALPAAVLFGGTVLWRLSGALYNRTQNGVRSFGFAFALTILGALFTESISIGTSAISLAMNINKQAQADVESRASYQSGERLSEAAAQAAARLQQDLANMPNNYRTESRKSSKALTELLQAQAELAQVQQQVARTGSATDRTFNEVGERLGMDGDQVKYAWALALAAALSIIPLGIQFALGATSDAHGAEKRSGSGLFDGSGTMEAGENISYITPKKPQRRDPRPTPEKKREVSVAAKMKNRDPMESTIIDSAGIDPISGQAIQALEGLGFKKREAKMLVDASDGDSVEMRVRNALRSSGTATVPKRQTVEQIADRVSDDIVAGKLVKVNINSLADYSNSRDTRAKVINILVRRGVLEKQSNGRVSIAA